MIGDVPLLVAHADWSTNPSKRWIAIGLPAVDGGWTVEAPTPVWDPGTLLNRLRLLAGTDAAVMVGFDFPIGIPRRYAAVSGISAFVGTLPRFGTGDFAQFYDVASSRIQISTHRPFYPNAPGGKRQSHLVEALGVESINDLRRQCDLAVPGHAKAACPLFWTLGANQVGKGAISGWRDVLAPALRDSGSIVNIWPFDGELRDLPAPATTTIVETYPALYYHRLGIRFGSGIGGKVSRLARKHQASAFECQMRAVRALPSLDLTEEIRAGFPDPGGDDRFDSLVGLIAMLYVLRGSSPFPATSPQTPIISQIEGWILGRNHA